MLEIANLVRRKRAFENKWKLYDIISKNPGLSIYDLSKKINWTPGKVDYYVRKLVKEDVIENSAKNVNNRIQKSFRARKVGHFINWDEMTHVQKPFDKDQQK